MRSNYDMSDFNPRLQNNLPNFPPVIGASNNDSKIVYDLIKPKINSFEEFLNLPEVKSTVNFLDDIQTNIIPLTSKIVDNYEEIKDFKPTQNPEHTSTDLVSTPALKTSQWSINMQLENSKSTNTIPLSSSVTIIGGNREKIADYSVPYFKNNQLFFTQEDGHLLLHESSSEKLVVCKKVSHSVLSIGSIFRLGFSNLQVEDICGQAWITLSISCKGYSNSYRVTQQQFSIGRSSENMIKTGEDQSISKCHAHVSNRMGLWIISDADSKKGIFRFLHNQTTLKEDLESPKIEIFDNDTLLFGKDTVMRVKKTDN